MQHGMKSEQSLKSISETSRISIFKGELTKLCIAESIAKMKKTFPALRHEFYDVLADRLKANGFSDSRLNAAVNHVIDTCTYPQPTIANIISYDVKIKLHTYNEIVAMAEPHINIFENYKPIKTKDMVKPMYAHINDIKKYKLEIYKNK